MAASVVAQSVSAAEFGAATVIALHVSVAKRSEMEVSAIKANCMSEARCQSLGFARTLRHMRTIFQYRGQFQATASYNKPLVPTRTGEAPVLSAQRQRWAEASRRE